MANCLFKLRDLYASKGRVVPGIGQLEFAGTRQSYMPNNQIVANSDQRNADFRRGLSLCCSCYVSPKQAIDDVTVHEYDAFALKVLRDSNCSTEPS